MARGGGLILHAAEHRAEQRGMARMKDLPLHTHDTRLGFYLQDLKGRKEERSEDQWRVS